MFHCNPFTFRDVHLFRKNLCESVDEHRLSTSLFVDRFADAGGERLSDFICILPKEFLHLFKRKIRQFKFVLDIEWRK